MIARRGAGERVGGREDREQLVVRERARVEVGRDAADDPDVDGAPADPAEHLLVVTLEQRDLDVRMAGAERGEDAGQEPRRDARERPEPHAAGRPPAARGRLLPDRLDAGEHLARVAQDALAGRGWRARPPPRVTSGVPSSASSAATARLTPGWLIARSAAAGEKPPWSATATRTRSCASVTGQTMTDAHWNVEAVCVTVMGPMTPRLFLMMLVLAAVWGASFLFMRVAVPALGPVVLACARVALAGAVLVVVALVSAGGWPRWRGRVRDWLVFGAVSAALPFALLAAAELEIDASLAAVLNATAPLCGALVAAVWLGERFSAGARLGLVLGVAGVALVVGLSPVRFDVAFAAAACSRAWPPRSSTASGRT